MGKYGTCLDFNPSSLFHDAHDLDQRHGGVMGAEAIPIRPAELAQVRKILVDIDHWRILQLSSWISSSNWRLRPDVRAAESAAPSAGHDLRNRQIRNRLAGPFS